MRHRDLTPWTSTSPLFLAALAFVFATGCGGGGGSGSGTSGFSNVDVLMSDAPTDDLLAFRATVNELHFVRQAGGETADLLAAPISVEFIGLNQDFAWLASQDLPAEVYTGVHLVFAPGSYDARRNDGTSVAVNALSDQATFSFTTPITVTPSNYKKVLIDLDLANSLTGDVASPPIVFDPQGSVIVTSTSTALDEVHGVVNTVNTNESTFVMDAYADTAASVPLGQVLVRVPSNAVLLQDDGTAFATRAAFLAALVATTTNVEVHGTLVSGAITATRIEVEDNTAGGGNANLVKIRGIVTELLPSETFAMSISTVERGESIVEAASGGSVPDTLQVTYDAGTVFVGPAGAIADSTALVVGSRLKVKFAQFTNPPYTASRIEVQNDGSENQGTITSTSGLPTTITLHLDGDAPAILGGEVATTSTDVEVTITGATIELDTQGHPALTHTSLRDEVEVEAQGTVGGTSTTPTIAATKVEVHAGELDDAVVNSVSAANSRFTTTGGTIEDPFGAGVTAGPQTVLIASNCVFTGDIATRSAFFNAYAGLTMGQSLVVRVKGLGTGNTNEIRAYEIRAVAATKF